MDLISELDEALKARINELAEQISGTGNPEAKTPPMPALLKAALKNEWETTLLTSEWVVDETDADLRVDLARLAGDEAKHYQWIRERLAALGHEPPLDELDVRTPLYNFLKDQKTTFDRVVTGPYAREALAVARNQVFLTHCREQGDSETIAIYEKIQADEEHHHRLGRRHLEQLLRTREDLDAAVEKTRAVLQVVEDIQEMIVMQKGLCAIPGC